MSQSECTKVKVTWHGYNAIMECMYVHIHSESKYRKNVQIQGIDILHTRVIEFLRNFEFRNCHAIRGGLMLPDSISEKKLEID